MRLGARSCSGLLGAGSPGVCRGCRSVQGALCTWRNRRWKQQTGAVLCCVAVCSYLRKAGEEEEEGGKAENPAMEMSNEPLGSCCGGS